MAVVISRDVIPSGGGEPYTITLTSESEVKTDALHTARTFLEVEQIIRAGEIHEKREPPPVGSGEREEA